MKMTWSLIFLGQMHVLGMIMSVLRCVMSRKQQRTILTDQSIAIAKAICDFFLGALH